MDTTNRNPAETGRDRKGPCQRAGNMEPVRACEPMRPDTERIRYDPNEIRIPEAQFQLYPAEGN